MASRKTEATDTRALDATVTEDVDMIGAVSPEGEPNSLARAIKPSQMLDGFYWGHLNKTYTVMKFFEGLKGLSGSLNFDQHI